MKLFFILLIVVSFLSQINCLIWSRTSNAPAAECCSKDSPDCCCIHHSGILVHFKQSGVLIPRERINCQHFKNCTTNGFACTRVPAQTTTTTTTLKS